MKRLPPLNSLRAFDAAARHLSFSQGAQELNVTQSAVSHQLKVLEDHLGQPLFKRSKRGLLLTDAGEMLFPVVNLALGTIASTIDRLNLQKHASMLTVSLRPYFSLKWLAWRLVRFWKANPDIGIRLHHTSSLVDFSKVHSDIAIVLGDRNRPDLDGEYLMSCNLTPVCNPLLLNDKNARLDVDDLHEHTLLHEEPAGNWRRWLALAGAPDLTPQHEIFIDDTNVRLQATINGQGFALGCPALIQDDINEERLVAPFESELQNLSYYIISPKESRSNPNVRAFKDWLLQEAQE